MPPTSFNASSIIVPTSAEVNCAAPLSDAELDVMHKSLAIVKLDLHMRPTLDVVDDCQEI